MDYKKKVEKLSDYVDGQLSESEKESVEKMLFVDEDEHLCDELNELTRKKRLEDEA